jgi:hypothetical protein
MKIAVQRIVTGSSQKEELSQHFQENPVLADHPLKIWSGSGLLKDRILIEGS